MEGKYRWYNFYKLLETIGNTAKLIHDRWKCQTALLPPSFYTDGMCCGGPTECGSFSSLRPVASWKAERTWCRVPTLRL